MARSKERTTAGALWLGVAMLLQTMACASIPAKEFVPDSQTAIRIAEAVWIPIYGEEQIYRERPFRAVLRGDTWVVSGTLPPGYVGGTAIAEISKRDGRILRVIHEE
jgi:hypothetical protein